MSSDVSYTVIQSAELLDTWLIKGLPQSASFDPKAELKKVEASVQHARSTQAFLDIITYNKYLDTFAKGTQLLRDAPPVLKQEEAVLKKVVPISITTSSETAQAKAKPTTTEPSGPSTVGAILSGALAIPMFVASIPTSFYQWITTPKATPEPDTSNVKLSDAVSAHEEVSKGEDLSRFRRADRIPVGLHNQQGNDCFLNAVRQMCYNTPIAEHLFHLLPKDRTDNSVPKVYPVTRQDYENYREQAVGTVMSGSTNMRRELLPANMAHGHQDAHEAFAQLFTFVDPNKCPLYAKTETIRTYDIGSLPSGVSYDEFTRESKESFQIGHERNSGLNISRGTEVMHILPIQRSDNNQVLGSLQEVWDYHMNPPFQRSTPLGDSYDFGAYLESSARVTQEMLEQGRVVRTASGRYKVLPDQIGEITRFSEAPEHLCFEFKRFSKSERFGVTTLSKINDNVRVDPTFTLDQNHIKGGKAANYQIQAFVRHSGGVSGGHYVAYVLDTSKNQWYECNDTQVTPISTSAAKAKMADSYIFYAHRIGEPFNSAERAIQAPIVRRPLHQDISIIPKKSRQPYGLDTKPPIRAQTPSSSTFKGEFTFANINQMDILNGHDSAGAQALGFLAKELNGTTVSSTTLGPLLDESTQAIQTHNSSSLAGRKEQAENKIVARLVREIEEFVTECKSLQLARIEDKDIAQFFLFETSKMKAAYQTKYKLPESAAFSQQLPSIVQKHLDGKTTKDQLTLEVKALLHQDKIDVAVEDLTSTSDLSVAYPAFQRAFGNSETPMKETIHLVSDTGMRQTLLLSILTARKEEVVNTNQAKAVGTVLSCNGSTHALALIKQESGNILYRIFDSQGKTELTGSSNAFIFEATDENEAAIFLEKLITYLPVDASSSSEGLNQLSLYTFIPKKEEANINWSSSVGTSLYNFGAYTVSGVYTVATSPFRGLAFLGRVLSSSCRSKPAPIKEVIQIPVVDLTSKESLRAEIARIRSKVIDYFSEPYTESDLDRLRKAFDHVSPACSKYDDLKSAASDIEYHLVSFARKLGADSKPKTRVTPSTTVSDPRELLPFYTGGKTNVHGFNLEQILNFSDKEMEQHHNFIQWIFPTNSVGVDPQAPLLNRELIADATNDPTFRKNMLRSFDKMLSYYGLERRGESVVKAANFNSRKQFWLINGKHNLFRMTRIITSMGTLGLKKEAKSFAQCIIAVHEKGDISDLGSAAGYWRNAMRDHT